MQILYIVLPSATHTTTMPLWGVQPLCPQKNYFIVSTGVRKSIFVQELS